MQTAGKGVKSYLPVSVPDSVHGLRVPLYLLPWQQSTATSLPVSFSDTCPSCPVCCSPQWDAESEKDRTPGLRHTQVHGGRKNCARKQNQEFIPFLAQAGGCSSVPRWAGLHPRQWWLGNTNTITASMKCCFSLLFPDWFFFHRVWEYPGVKSRSLVPPVSLLLSGALPTPSLAGQDEEQERPWLWAGTKTYWNLPISSPNPSPAPEKLLRRKLTPHSVNQSPMPIPQHQGPVLSVLCTQPWQGGNGIVTMAISCSNGVLLWLSWHWPFNSIVG